MARYHLILKNETFIILFQEAARQGKTIGKLINEILNREAEKMKGGLEAGGEKVCVVCGVKATVEAHGFGQQQFFVCPSHRDLARKVKSWRDINSL